MPSVFVFGAALLLYAAGLVPLGALPHAATPASALGGYGLALVPLGDAATRLALASAVAAAALLALLEGHARAALGEAPAGRVASSAAALLVGLVLVVFRQATSSGGALAAPLLAAAALLLAARVARDFDDARLGLGLALVCGLCAGAGAAAPVVVWPPGLLLTLLAARRGERWPLLAPLLFVAGAGAGLARPLLGGAEAPWAAGVPGVAAYASGVAAHASGVAAHASGVAAHASGVAAHASGVAAHASGVAAHASGVAALWPSLATPDFSRVPAVAVHVAEDMGVLGLPLALVGFLFLFARQPAAAALAAWALVAALALGPLAAPIAAVALAAPLAAGIAGLADRLGAARVPAAVALSVMALVQPAATAFGFF